MRAEWTPLRFDPAKGMAAVVGVVAADLAEASASSSVVNIESGRADCALK